MGGLSSSSGLSFSPGLTEGVSGLWSGSSGLLATHAAAVPDGVDIANQANTTVTASAPYWNVVRTTGGGAYDAAAVSADGIVGNYLLTINRVAGTFVAGVALDPTLADDISTIIGFLSDGANIYTYSYSSQRQGPLANKAFMFLRWNTGVDQTLRFYTGDTAVFADAGAPVDEFDLTAFGWSLTAFKFDSSLNTASAEFNASLVAM